MKLKWFESWLGLQVTWIDSVITTFSSCWSFADLLFVACIVFASVRNVLFFRCSQSYWDKGITWKRHQSSGLASCGTLYMSDDGDVVVPLLSCIPFVWLWLCPSSDKEIKLPKVLQGLYLFLMARKDWMIWTASFLKKICPFPVSPRGIGHISRFSKTAYAILHVWKWCNLSDTWTRNQKTSLYVWKTLGLSASCLKICSVYFWWSGVQ